MPKTNTPKHKASFYLSVPVAEYLVRLTKLTSENKSQLIKPFTY